MDVFARALITAEKMLNESDYKKLRRERYALYDSGAGLKFEKHKLKLEDLREIALKNTEPKQRSGK